MSPSTERNNGWLQKFTYSLILVTLALTILYPFLYYVMRPFSRSLAEAAYKSISESYEIVLISLYSAIAIFLTIYKIIRKRFSRYDWIYILLVVWMGFSVFYVESYKLFIPKFFLMLSGFGVFVSVEEALYGNIENLKKLTLYLGISIGFIALLTLMVNLYRLVAKGEFSRLGFPYAHPNQIACLFVIALPILFYSKFELPRLFVNTIIFLVFISVFLTGSRGSMMALIEGSLLSYIVFREYRKDIRASIFIVALIVAFLIVAGLITHRELAAVVLRLKSESFISFKYRYDAWLKGVEYLKMGTIFLGVGTGQFPIYIDYPGSMHNQFLQLLFENGVTGFGLFLILLFLPLTEIKDLKSQLNSLKERKIQVYLMWSYFILLFSFLTETRLKSFKFCFFFAYLLALVSFNYKSKHEHI